MGTGLGVGAVGSVAGTDVGLGSVPASSRGPPGVLTGLCLGHT